MKLSKYNEKRDFDKTKEPIGKVKFLKNSNRLFVVQYHMASTKHYDFRMSFGGVLISFAVPKGLPENGEKRLAIHVEDHPLDYINFEGEIPKGQYGAGKVEIVDKGQYEPLNKFRAGLKSGKLKFALFGKIYFGIYTLVKLNDNNWLFIKDSTN